MWMPQLNKQLNSVIHHDFSPGKQHYPWSVAQWWGVFVGQSIAVSETPPWTGIKSSGARFTKRS